MKFRVSFKTPDAFDQVISDHSLNDEGKEDEHYDAKRLFEKFTEYGEYVTIEFDTANDSAKVIER